MQLRILGGMELSAVSGAQVPDVTKQTRLILACLALAGAKGLTRVELCSLFWPDRPAGQARNSLRQSLTAIRKALASDTEFMSLQSDLEVVRLLAVPSSVDLHTFRLGMEKDDRNGRIAAAHAFQGELLAGVQASDDVEQFVGSHRQSLNSQAECLAERLSMSDAADGEALEAGQSLAHRLLRTNPASEESHRALMRVHLRHGRTNAALRQFELCKAVLQQELQAEPEAETIQLYGSLQTATGALPGNADRAEGSVPAATSAASGRPTQPKMTDLPSESDGQQADGFTADVMRAGTTEQGVGPAAAPHNNSVDDPPIAESAAAELLTASIASPQMPTSSAGAVRSPKSAWLVRLDQWLRAARRVEPRRVAVGSLLLLALGAVFLVRSRSVSAPMAPLTMQAAPTIAVLPFKASENASSGIASAFGAEIRSELARSMRYLDIHIRAGAPGEAEAGQVVARYVVAGTILGQSRDRESIVTIQLTEAESGRLVWSESAGFEPGDGPALNRIAARFARALAIQVRTAEARRPLPARPEAGHYAMMGHALGQDKNTAATVDEALALFKKALAIDDNSSTALHGLAWARLVQVMNSYIPESEHPAAIAEAKSAIDRLLTRDPRNPATHFLRGNMFRARKDVAEAIAAYEYTLSLNPNHQWAHASLGRMMIEVGQAREAIGKIELAIRLHPSDPLNHSVYHWAGVAALHAGDDRAAVDWLLKSRLANPDYPSAMLWLAMAYCSVGEIAKAHANLAEYMAIRPGVSIKSFRRSQATSNPVVAEQRERLVGLLRKLGVAEDREAAVQK